MGALILKEFNGLTDDEMIEEMECDIRYEYALHTMSYDRQTISDRTFSRFRERTATYEPTTGVDLIHECVTKLAEKLREFIEIEPTVKRMDSMMIESNIRKMGRLEPIYTCLSNLVKIIHNDLIVDGAYGNAENVGLAKVKIISLVSKNLLGLPIEEIASGPEFNEDDKNILKCPAGHSPKNCCYSSNAMQYTALCQRDQYESCPYKNQCRVKIFKK